MKQRNLKLIVAKLSKIDMPFVRQCCICLLINNLIITKFTNIKNLIKSKQASNQFEQIFEDTSLPTRWQNLIKIINSRFKYIQVDIQQLPPLNDGKPNLDTLIKQFQFYFKKPQIKIPYQEPQNLNPFSQVKILKKMSKLVLDDSEESQIINEQYDEETNNLQLNNNFQYNEQEEYQNKLSHDLSKQSEEVNSQQINYKVKSLAQLTEQIKGYKRLNKFLRIFANRKILEDLSDTQNEKFCVIYKAIKLKMRMIIFYYKINDKSCIFKTKMYIGESSSTLEHNGFGQIYNYQQNSKYIGKWKDGKEEDTDGIWERLEKQYLKYGDIYKYQGSFNKVLFEGKGFAFLNHQNQSIQTYLCFIQVDHDNFRTYMLFAIQIDS